MQLLAKIGNTCTRYVALIIILLSAWAFLMPGLFAWATGYTAIFLGVIMFGMGLTISAADFKVVFTHPKEVLLGAIAQYTIMPLSAWSAAAREALHRTSSPTSPRATPRSRSA